MPVVWLRRALSDLQSELDYLAKQNHQAAKQQAQAIKEAVNLLAYNPALGRVGRVGGTRELVINKAPYLIPYRLNTAMQRIEILRVFHTSRKPSNSWR